MNRFAALAILNLAVQSVWATPCLLPTSAEPKTLEMVEKNGGFRVPESQCNFLRQRNLLLEITAENIVLKKAAIGWAKVALVDGDGIASDTYQVATSVNTEDPSSPIAERLAITSIRGAIKILDFELAAREIDAKRKRIKDTVPGQ